MDQPGPGAKPFRLAKSRAGPIRRVVGKLIRPALHKTLGFDTLNRIYDRTQSLPGEHPFVERALEALNVRCDLAASQIEQIPAAGPLVVVANHPFGGLEGLILEALLRRVRSDVKLLVNYLLSIVPDLRPSYLFVDPFGRPDSVHRNVASIKSAIRWVKSGHALGVFPSGEVSHLRLRDWGIVEPTWNPTAARIIQIAGATVVPMFFEGRNSSLFQLLGLIHPRLRTALLPRELLKKRNSVVTVRVGRPIGPDRLKRFNDPAELIEYLRVRTYVLRERAPAAAARPAGRMVGRLFRRVSQSSVEVAAPGPADRLAQRVRSLPGDQRLVQSGEFSVWFCRADEAPEVMHEIGRLRELAFRNVGEGTGGPLDIDRFDEQYFHLFVWNDQREELVGAYRLGRTEDILPRFGVGGLYTSTLFDYGRQLLDQIGPALELGRSFVRLEYQRTHSPLTLLWRGIGRYVTLNPRYKMLFGPVSISNQYQSVSKQLLVEFLRQNRYRPELAQMVRPKQPPHFAPNLDWSPRATSVVVRDLEEVDDLIGQIERNVKSVPVLLRQYLKLNGMLLGLNVDPAFNEVLDVLMLIDLTAIDPAILVRYMGRADAGTFLGHHGLALPPSRADRRAQEDLSASAATG